MEKAILGGGLSGLSVAYYLTRNNPLQKVNLFEASSRTGGWIKSNILQDGTIFEQGPRTIRPRGAPGVNTLELVEELGLSNEVVHISSHSPAAQRRLIYAKGKLNLLPSSLGGLFKIQEPFTKPLIFHLANDFKAKKKATNDDSIYDFVDRRFGTEIADYLISPLICGICAGDPKKISVNFLFRNLFEYEQKYGSITRGVFSNIFSSRKGQKHQNQGLSLRAQQENWNVYSFQNGCETLPKSLEKSIEKNGVTVNLNSNCEEISFSKDKVDLKFSNESLVTSDLLISTIPAVTLGNLVEKQHPKLATLLRSIKNVTVGVVNLQFDKKVLKDEAFGFLAAPKENLPILGVIYDSCCFPKDDNHTVLTVMMGGAWFDKHFGKNVTENQMFEIAIQHLKIILEITDDPIHSKVNILKNCLPQYVVGHDENLQRIGNYIRQNNLPLHLTGASYHGVGVNDVILSSRRVVENL